MGIMEGVDTGDGCDLVGKDDVTVVDGREMMGMNGSEGLTASETTGV